MSSRQPAFRVFAIGVVTAVVASLLGLPPLGPTLAGASVGSSSATDAARPARKREQPRTPEIAKAKRAPAQDEVVVTTPVSRSVQSGGKVRAEFYSAPEFRQTPSGWRRVSGAVSRDADGVSAVSSAVPTTFGRADRDLVSLDFGTRSVSLRLLGARPVAPRIATAGSVDRDGVVRYEDVMAGVDLGYEVSGSAVKEKITITSADAPRSYAFMVDDPQHRLGGVTEVPGGGFAFDGLTADGMTISLTAPTAWEQDAEQLSAPGDGSAWQKVTRVPGGYRLEVGLDPAWAARAAFPVVLDPTLSYSWPDGTLASGFGRSWWSWASQPGPDGEAPIYQDCLDEFSCYAMVNDDGSMFVANDVLGYNTAPDQRGYAGYVGVDTSVMPWYTRIERATLGVDVLPASEVGYDFPLLMVRPVPAMQTVGRLPYSNPGDVDAVTLGHVSYLSDPYEPPTSSDGAPVHLEADVTSAFRDNLALGLFDQMAFTIGDVVYPCLVPELICPNRAGPKTGGRAEAGASSSSTTEQLSDGPWARWLRNPSITVEYSGTILPPPLPVDQTFGCDCADFGNGSNTVSHDADPINTASGTSLETAIDARLASPGNPLPWARTLNGSDDADGPMGVGWTHTYNASVTESTTGDGVTTAVLTDPTGGRWRWTRAADGSYVKRAGVRSRLVAIPGGGWRVTTNTGRVLTFDAQGRETSDHDRYGRGMDLGYQSGRLTSLTDTAGSETTLTYGTSGPGTGKVVEVDLPGGRSLGYVYAEVAGEVRLASVIDPLGQVTSYAYDEDGLTGITDGEGHTRALNRYADGRVVEQAEPTSTAGDERLWTFDWKTPPGAQSYPDGTGIQTTTDPDGVTTKQYYYGNVMFRSVDGAGGMTDYTYDADANLVAVRDPLGYVTTMTYDDRGNMLTRTSPAPESITETWTYNADDQVTTHSNGAGETTTTTYASGRRASTTNAIGGVTEYNYNAAGLTSQIKSPAGRITKMTYDAAGNMLSQVQPSGATTTWTYDAAGNVLTETTPRGNTTTWTYDEAGQLLTQTDALGTVTTHAYDGAGLRTSTTIATPGGSVLREHAYTYDIAGRLLNETLAGRTIADNSYTPAGRLDASSDAEGRTTYYSHDATGRQVSRYGPGPDLWQEFDAAGRLRFREQGGVQTSYGYDSAGRVVTTATGDNPPSVTAYDDANRPVSVTDPAGGTTTTSYDDLGRITGQSLPGRPPATFTYDADGNLLSQTSPSGLSKYTWTYTADSLLATETRPQGNRAGAPASLYRKTFGYDLDGNRITSKHYPASGSGQVTWTARYDELGRRVEDKDPRGRTTAYQYDRLGQQTGVTAPDGAVTAYGYDDFGNRTSITDARNHTTRYTYNAAGQLLTETDPLDRTQTYTYDWDGNVESHTNARGQTLWQVSDDGGRLTYRGDSLEVDQSFRYDPAGRLVEFADSTGTTTLGYDGRGLLTSVDQPGTDDYGYTYTAAGNVASRTYPSGAPITYTYNADGLTETQTRDGRTTSYEWNADRQITKINYPTQVDLTQEISYFPTGQISKITSSHNDHWNQNSGFSLSRDEFDSPTARSAYRHSTSTSDRFTYNSRGWLTRWCKRPATGSYSATCDTSYADRVDYTYDAVGNQTSVAAIGDMPDPGTITMTYDAANQRATTTRSGGANPGTVSHTWDADGNNTDGGRQYNSLNQLVAAQTPSGDAVAYDYNGLGQRRATTVGGDTTHWSWDINNPLPTLAETSVNAGPATQHDYTPDGWALSSGVAGQPDQAQWYTHDPQGSIRNSFTGTGVPAHRFDYDPWGEVTSDVTVTPDTPSPAFGYTSAPTDPGTGDWHLRARDYDPDLRSFSSPDPAASSLHSPLLSTYTYTSNQPMTYVDPSGRYDCWDWVCDSAENVGGWIEDNQDAIVAGATALAAAGTVYACYVVEPCGLVVTLTASGAAVTSTVVATTAVAGSTAIVGGYVVNLATGAIIQICYNIADGDGPAAPEASSGGSSGAASEGGTGAGSRPPTVDDVSALVPEGQTLNTWGSQIWGRGTEGARELIGKRSAEELRRIRGLNLRSATMLRDFYQVAASAGKGGTTAPVRVQLLNDIIKRLGG